MLTFCLAVVEIKNGFTKNDKIMPVITLTVYFGAKEWDAPRCLKDMFSEDVNVEILNEIDDYKLGAWAWERICT